MQRETPPKQQASAARTLALGILLIIAIGASLLLLTNLSRQPAAQAATPRPTNTPNVGAGETVTLIDPGRELTDFTLPASTGAMMSLSEFNDRTVLLYFGYTHCPDFCPTTMAQFAAVRESLGELGSEVQGIMVSVDPARDTPQALAGFVTRFDPTFIGLQGDEDTLRSIAPDYGLEFYIPQAGESVTPQVSGGHAGHESRDGYLVDHTVSSYLIHHGLLRAVFSYGTPTAEIAQTVQRYVDAEG